MFGTINLKIINGTEERFSCTGDKIDAVFNGEYREGDKIIIHKTDTEYLALKLDETMAESIVYAPGSKLEYEIPFGELKKGYNKEAFSGTTHRITVYEPTDEVKYGYRNIALNPYDKRGQKRYFPHVYANMSEMP